MIIAIADQCGTCGRSIGDTLAQLRAGSGRKVLVIDTQPPQPAGAQDRGRLAAGVAARVPRRIFAGRSLSAELEQLIPRYQDIVIETDGRDMQGRAALIAAQLAIVPIQAGQADRNCHYALIARLDAARMFNPGLHVRFVVAAGPAGPSSADMLKIRDYVAQVMSARLCATVIHAHDIGDGPEAADLPGTGSASSGACEMTELYHDVFPA
jgi:chromosome partitioning protein